MLTILYDPAGLAGSERHRWDFSLSIQANIERHLTSGAGCKVRLNGQEIDPVSHPAMDRPPTVADFVTVVRRPEGFFDPFTWAIIAVAAIAAASFVLLQRPNVGGMATGKDSPNNKLTAQSNVARAYQAIPDVYGYRRVWPDMIQPSTVEYIDHIKYVTEWLCVSRGRGDISSVQYAETPIDDIAGASYEIFQPVAAGGYPEQGSTTLYDVVETFESPEVNGQEILYSTPWSVVSGTNGVVNATIASPTFTLRVPDSPGLDQLKSIAGAGNVNVSVFHEAGEDSKSFNGLCSLDSFAVAGGNCTFTLTRASGVFMIDWVDLISKYDLDPQRSSYNPIGPFTLPVDADRIRWNTVFLRGLKYSITIRVDWWKVDSSGVEISGTRQSQDFGYSANTYDPRFYTNEVSPSAGHGRYRVQFTRLTPQQGDQGTDLAKLEELYAVRHYDQKVLPGVTVIRLTTKATTEATGYSDRKFNLRWQRHVRNVVQGADRYAISASRNFARAIAHMWDLAGNDMNELDLAALQAINDDQGEWSPLLRFDASLDDADMSLGERMQLAADTARCVIWRDGRKWTCVRDQARAYPELQLDYRNLAASGESSITENAHLPASYDGIELEYVNEADQSKKSYIRINIASGAPVHGVSTNPKKVQLTCCTTYSQAENRAQLEARKLIYQRTSVSDTALTDAGDLGLGALVRWIDPNDFGGDDGLQAGEVMAISGNLIATSEPVDWHGETQGRILFTGADGRHLGAPIVCYPAGDLIELASVPEDLFVADGIERQLGSRYAFAVGLTQAEIEAAGLYTVTSNKPDSGGNRALALVAYDARVYEADTSPLPSMAWHQRKQKTEMPTDNPIPSSDPADLLFNAPRFDEFMNAEGNHFTDRKGRQRNTLSSLERDFPNAGENMQRAEIAASSAVNAAGRAESAMDGAIVGAGFYPNEATGRAAVADGETFKVEGQGDVAAFLYRRINAENSTLLSVFPSTDKIRGADSKASTAEERMPLRNFGDWPYAIAGDDQVPIIGVKPSGFAKVVTDELPGADLLDPRYRYAVIDQTTGDLLVAYRWDGAAINGAARLLDGEYSHVWADEEGNILFARRWDGALVPGGARGEVAVYAQGKPGRRSIWAFVDGLPCQLTSTGDAWAPEIAAGNVNYLARQAGGVVKATAALGGKYAPFAQRCIHIIASGQSLAVGNNGAATSTRPDAANRVLAPAFGARKTDTATPILPAEVGPFVPLRSVIGEAPVIELSNRLALDCMAPADAITVTSLHASGAKSITELNKGTVYYDNSLLTVTGAKLQCDTDGLPYAVGFIDWIQGEKDCKSAAGVYAAALLQLQTDYTSDIAAITGQAGQVPILLDQISNWTAYGVATSFVPLEQLQAALDQPGRFYCAGPKYWLKTNADGVHINSAESIAAGKMHAVAAEKLLAGEPWLPTHCTSAVRNGTQVTLSFHTPLGNLVADTERVSDPGNLGLRWIDSTSSAAITRVVVNADNTVTVTLDQIPSGSDPQIGIADQGISGNAGGPTTGARACLRTSVPSTFSDGSEIYHWACHQRINVTTI